MTTLNTSLVLCLLVFSGAAVAAGEPATAEITDGTFGCIHAPGPRLLCRQSQG